MKHYYLESLIIVCALICSCTTLPKEKLYQFKLDYNVEERNDSIIMSINNTLHCPLQFSIKYDGQQIDSLLGISTPSILLPFQDTQLVISPEFSKEDIKPNISITFGDPGAEIHADGFTLPFPKGKQYKIIQAYHGSFSHNTDYSRYAIDFNTQVGDTVCAAANGYVIGVIEDYKHGGNNRKWRPYSNFLTLYHPEQNLYTQYVHLDHKGILVELGDTVSAGQAVGISGLTGFTDVEHLHFNVLRPIKLEMIGIPVSFKGGLKGEDLKPNHTVRHPEN